MLLPDIRLSLAQLLLHCQLHDNIPSHLSHYKLQKEWILTAEQREKALSKCNHLLVQRYNSKAQELFLLAVSNNVVLQCPDQNWNHTGKIVEVMPNQQHCIRMFHHGQEHSIIINLCATWHPLHQELGCLYHLCWHHQKHLKPYNWIIQTVNKTLSLCMRTLNRYPAHQ